MATRTLRDQWRAGDRDRELALHLLFLAWYLNLEPSHLTGLDETRVSTEELPGMFSEVHDWLLPDGANSDDAEALFVAGLPAIMAPWLLGDVDLWTARSEAYRVRYRQFEGRGAYGDYYAGQASVPGGFWAARGRGRRARCTGVDGVACHLKHAAELPVATGERVSDRDDTIGVRDQLAPCCVNGSARRAGTG